MAEEMVLREHFLQYTGRRDGYIVITDDVRRPARAHPADCQGVQFEHYFEKVVKNERKTGRYFWVSTMTEARDRFDATPCQCHR